jgi:hypothetical protein
MHTVFNKRADPFSQGECRPYCVSAWVCLPKQAFQVNCHCGDLNNKSVDVSVRTLDPIDRCCSPPHITNLKGRVQTPTGSQRDQRALTGSGLRYVGLGWVCGSDLGGRCR